jgi:prephenate dehydrogenase
MIGRMRIAIVGFGLIGGSIARALRRPDRVVPPSGSETLVAWSRHPDGPRAALEAGVLDEAAAGLADALGGSELIVLAAPPLACLALLDELAGPARSALAPDATLTDVASTKAALVGRADRLGLRFVGGHPMAGREESGYGAAMADLFHDRPWLVCPGAFATDRDVGRVEWLATACGARPLRIDPGRHDALVAAISHVPLVLSAALAESVLGRADAADALALAAGGWRDMTRLASGDPEMGAGIAATNASEMAAGLRATRAAIDAWLAALDASEPDAAALETRLADVRRRLAGG